MKIEFFTIDELNYFKEHCDFTEDELYLLDEKSKGKTLEETGFDINTLKSVKRKIRKALEDREIKTMTVAKIKDFIKQEISFQEEEMEHHEINVDIKHHINCLDQVKDMLDELEDRPKAKWVATERHLYMCTNCESEFIETSEHNYCPNCGARMEVEDDTTPTNV